MKGLDNERPESTDYRLKITSLLGASIERLHTLILLDLTESCVRV